MDLLIYGSNRTFMELKLSAWNERHLGSGF